MENNEEELNYTDEDEIFDPVFDPKKWEIARGIYVRLIQNKMGVCAQIKLDMGLLNAVVKDKGFDRNTLFVIAFPKPRIKPNAETHFCIFDVFDARNLSIYLKGNNGFTMRDTYNKGVAEKEDLKEKIQEFVDKQNISPS